MAVKSNAMLSKLRHILNKSTLKAVFEYLNSIYGTLHLPEHNTLIQSNDFMSYRKEASGNTLSVSRIQHGSFM